MGGYTLGLDLGSNSVGWALIRTDGGVFQETGTSILAGVRVFPAGVADMNTGKEKARGQERREKRSQRRVHYRRRGRRSQLRRALQESNLLPEDEAELASVMAENPYALRARGLDEKLEPHHVGRALYHLCQRRGFKSNRKSESDDENKVTKDASALQAELEDAGCRTLGEYRWRLQCNETVEKGFRVRGRYTLRTMYEHEFESFWDCQRRFHPRLLTDDLRKRVYDAIFFQRPLRFDPEVIGDCELERGEKRCPIAHWVGQQFRMLQEINNLRVMDAEGDRPLNQEERAKLAEALGRKKERTFDQIRKCLGFLKDQTFNLESEGKRKKLKGNVVEAALQHRTLAKWYKGLSPKTRGAVYDALADVQDPENLRHMALDQWGATEKQAGQLLKFSPPKGYFGVSAKAIRKMLPYLQPDHVCDGRCREMFSEKDHDAGHVVSEAKQLAGYPLEPELPLLDRLPAIPDRRDKKRFASAHPALRQMGTALTNPLVRRALAETRKVVNAIVREHGKPGKIVVELARDMKHSRDQRRDIHFENIRRQDENEEIRQRLQTEFNVANPSRDDVIKYRLWEECGGVCVYTGKTIPKSKVLSPEIQIEHIYPLDRSLDDSYLNKTLCYGPEVNIKKGNKTPWEAYGETPKFDQILQRAKRLPWKKRRRFTVKEVKFDNFAQRQLNDTRYASRLATRYLKTLGVEVRPVKGQTTNKLGHYWGLYGVLGTDYRKARDDHRYHAIDAIVVALTSRSHLQRLSTVLGGSPRRTPLEPPWKDFWDDVKAAVEQINVSHRPARKLAGKLHKELNYGPTAKPDTFVYRVPLDRLTTAMVKNIRDPAIRSIVRARLAERGIEEKGSSTPGKVLTEPPLTMPSGVPIKRVRIETTERTAIPIRRVNGEPVKYVLPGGNHHVEIYEKPDGSWTGRCVSRFEAQEQLRSKQPVVDRRDQPDGSKFVMSLCINDMAWLTNPKTGEVALYRVQKISDGPDVKFRLHTAARIDDEKEAVRLSNWDMGKKGFRHWRVQKVHVDPLGRLP